MRSGLRITGTLDIVVEPDKCDLERHRPKPDAVTRREALAADSLPIEERPVRARQVFDADRRGAHNDCGMFAGDVDIVEADGRTWRPADDRPSERQRDCSAATNQLDSAQFRVGLGGDGRRLT